jgi:hypothetical protein
LTLTSYESCLIILEKQLFLEVQNPSYMSESRNSFFARLAHSVLQFVDTKPLQLQFVITEIVHVHMSHIRLYSWMNEK